MSNAQNFRRFEATIEKALTYYPTPVKVNMPGLTTASCISMLRKAKKYLLDTPLLDTKIDRANYLKHHDVLTVFDHGDGVYIGQRESFQVASATALDQRERVYAGSTPANKLSQTALEYIMFLCNQSLLSAPYQITDADADYVALVVKIGTEQEMAGITINVEGTVILLH